MADQRLPKGLIYGELQQGIRSYGGQKNRFGEILNISLKAFGIHPGTWNQSDENRDKRHSSIHRVSMTCEANRTAAAKARGQARKARPGYTSSRRCRHSLSALPKNLLSTDWPCQPPARPQTDPAPTTLGWMKRSPSSPDGRTPVHGQWHRQTFSSLQCCRKISWCFEPNQPQKDYIRAEHKLHAIFKLFISQVIIPQVFFCCCFLCFFLFFFFFFFFEPVYIPRSLNTETLHSAGWPISFYGATQEPELATVKIGRKKQKQKKQQPWTVLETYAGKWIGRVEISNTKIPGSKRNVYGYMLTYSRL